MTIDILTAMQECFDYLLEKQKDNPNLLFVPRKSNKFGRLEKGYFFIGTDNYMQISFWVGKDWKQKVHSIAFVVGKRGNISVEFSATEDASHKEYIKGLADYFQMKTHKVPEIKKYGKWFFYYENDNTHYLKRLSDFVENEKGIIDEYLRKNTSWIEFPDEDFNKKYVLQLKDKYPQLHDCVALKALENDNISYIDEGNKKRVYTYIYERSKENRKKAIKICEAKNNGKLICSVCGFDFVEKYGDIGEDFIEVHHNKPLCSNNGVETPVNPETDLDCVCSNCHRMLHKLDIAPTIENLMEKCPNLLNAVK